MQTVHDLLKVKGNAIWAISPNATVFEAIQLMAAKDIGAVLVTEGARLVGILSERDYTRHIILEGRSSKNTLVRAIMTANVVCVHPHHTIEECMALITEKRIRHLPVVENGRLVGVISSGDVIRAINSEQARTIKNLETFILGTVSLTTGMSIE